MQTISNTQTCTLSHFYDTTEMLEWLTVDCCYHFLLVEGVRRDGGQDQYCPVFVTWYQPLRDSLLPPPSPPTLSRIMDHKTARTHARAAGGWRGAWTPFDHRVYCDPSTVNEPAVMHVISADTTVADTIHPVSVPIRYRSDNRPFSKEKHQWPYFRKILWWS